MRNAKKLCEDGFYVLDECKGTLDKYDFSCEQIISKKFTDGFAFSAYYSLELNKILYGDMNGKVHLYDVSVMAVVKSGVVIVAVCDESGNITCELLFEAEGETKDIASDCYNQDKLDGVLDLPEVSGSDDMVKAINKMLDEYNIRLLYNSDTFNESMSMFEIEEDSEEAVLARVKDINLFL